MVLPLANIFLAVDLSKGSFTVKQIIFKAAGIDIAIGKRIAALTILLIGLKLANICVTTGDKV